MEITLSQEKSGIKLFIQEISLMEIVSALKDELVNVELYNIGFANDFTVDSEGKDVTTSFTITEGETILGEIIDMVVSFYPLSEMETINLERLKAGFPQLLEEGLSVDEIWERFLRTTLEQEQPYELKLGNDAFYLEAYPHLGYLLTFQSKDKLVSFIENTNLMLSGKTSEDFMSAVREEKPYATDGFKAVFEEAGKMGQIDTFYNIRRNPDMEPSKNYPIELVVTSHHNYLNLLTEGLSLQDLSAVFKNETVFVTDLSFAVCPVYTIENADFKKGDDFYEFNPQKIHFGHLVDRLTSLNLPENLSEPDILDLVNSHFELNSRWSFYPPMYRLVFWHKEVMTEFLNGFESFVSKEIVGEMKKAVQEGKDYCTEGCRSDFEKARNMYRIESMIGLLERVWVTNEEQELIKALKIVVQSQQSQPANEVAGDDRVKLTEDEKKIYGSSPWKRPHPYFLVYYRLLNDRMKCFDGNGKIYGFDGEMVINSIIANFSQSKSEIKHEMETLLTYYKKRFHQFN